MTRNHIKQLFKECLNEVLTDQAFDSLRDNVGVSTEIGKAWSKLLYSLETLYEETKDFESLYTTSMSKYGKPANIQDALRKIEQITALAQAIKPAVISMDDIQRRDLSI
jgi:undecaprenyl pyrophosphate synthase